MKDLVLMSKTNGAICIGIPLFRIEESRESFEFDGYLCAFSVGEPLAFVLDIGLERCEIVSAEFVEDHLECLGEMEAV